MKSVQQHDFAQIPQANIQRSVFNLSHGHKTTFNAGYLIPILAMEIYPGDTFTIKGSMLARIASPLTYPIMDNMKLDAHYFFVPHRLVWSNFQKFMGEKDNPNDSTVYAVPTVSTPAVTGVTVETLMDYLNVVNNVPGKAINALYTRSYSRIYRDWYKDQNLINDPVIDTDDGPDSAADYVLRKRAKYHDYFTSCLPWPQKGVAVELPLGNEAPVLGIGKYNQTWFNGPVASYETDATAPRNYAKYFTISNAAADDYANVEEDPNNPGYPYIRADLKNATAATINSLREAFQLQVFYEVMARGGSRYVEILRSSFGVISPDARLQRVEFLGGSSSELKTNLVVNTSATATEKQGSLAAWGEIRNFSSISKSFVEHGLLFCIISTRADLTYQQGLHRKFSRSSKFDFMWPQFAHLGEQAVLTQEIYCDGSATDDDVFGYQERYAELRCEPSKISGKFRSTYAQSLDAWHLSQEFGSAPTLSQTFIEETPPMDRVKAVTTEPDFIFDSYFDIKAARALPTYGTPGRIDHF